MTVLVDETKPIAVVAPSGAFKPERLEAGLALVQEAGFATHVFADMLAPHRYLAAPDAVRLQHLTQALTSPDYSAVWAVRGGYGMTRLLPHIPWDQVVPKPVIGFSDITPLLEAMRQRFDVPMVHGPVLNSLDATLEPARHHLFALLRGEPTAPLAGTTWVDGVAEGPLVGGNLAMLAATCGTPFQPDTRGAILALEDIAEAPYKIDRLLQQLRSSGLLDQVAGIALGSFTGCDAPASAAWHLHDVFHEHLGGLGVPVVAQLPFGHDVATNHALPIGMRARLAHGSLHWTPAINA